MICRVSLKVGRGRGDRDAGTRVWDAGLGDVRPKTWGRVYGGTWIHGDAKTRGRGVVKIGEAISGTRGGEKQKEPFSSSNEYKIQ